jgi:hypothetical protein
MVKQKCNFKHSCLDISLERGVRFTVRPPYPLYKLYKRREENQLDATECFIALIICSTRFRHLYAHHQELDTIVLLLLHVVCDGLFGGGRLLGAGQQAMSPG